MKIVEFEGFKVCIVYFFVIVVVTGDNQVEIGVPARI